MRKQALAAVSAVMITMPANAATTGSVEDPGIHTTQDNDDDIPWGLLGLLGLAGLMGLKRRDRDDRVDVNRTGSGGTSNRM